MSDGVSPLTRNGAAELGFEQKIFNTRGVLAVDFNRDGALDVVFNNEGQESGVFLGKPPEKTVGRR